MVLLIALSAACGGSSSDNASTTSTEQAPAPDPAVERQRAAKEAERRAVQRAELRTRKSELAMRVKEAERAVAELEDRQQEELASQPPTSKARRIYAQTKRDAARKVADLQRMEKRLKDLEGFAQSKEAGELKAMRAKRGGIQARYDKALSGWQQTIADRQHGVVEASPVKRDLDTLRAMRVKWFEATPTARRGTAGASARKIINNGFRSWLNEKPERKQLCSRVLTQPDTRGTPDGYDFCNLEFYLLMELLEDQLDRANVAVERKELTQTEARLQEIQEELDVVDEQIELKMQAGGPEFEEYLDLKGRIKTVRNITDQLVRSRDAWEQLYMAATSIRDRHTRESEEANEALEAARKKLVETDRKLRGLGG